MIVSGGNVDLDALRGAAGGGRLTSPMALLTLLDAHLAYGDVPLLDRAALSVPAANASG